MKILGLIPARKGSKGLKNKNFTKFFRKPLIHFTLKTAYGLNKVLYPFISSDSPKILRYSKKLSIDGYLRPKKYAGDKSKIIDVIFHALNWLKKNKNQTFDAVALLQPTSPNRKSQEIKRCIGLFKKKRLNSIFICSKMYQHPYECLSINKKGKWNFLNKIVNKKLLRRQEYEGSYFYIDGSFYIAKVNFLKKYKTFLVKDKSHPFISSIPLNVDINDKFDLKLAKLLNLQNEK